MLNEAGSNESKYEIQKKIIHLHKNNNNDSLAYTNCLKLKNYVNNNSSQATIIEHNIMLAKCHRDLRKFKQSINYFTYALNITKSTGKHTVFNIYEELGNTQILDYQLTKGLENLLMALDGFKDNRDSTSIANCLNDVGKAYQYIGNYDISLEYHFEALQFFEVLHDHKGTALAYNNIGVIYKNQKDYEQALKYYRNALAIRRAINDYEGIADCYNNIGVVHRRQKKLDEAEEYFYNAINMRRKNAFNELKASYSLENLGNVYLDKNEARKAIVFFDSALFIKEKFNNKRSIVKSLINLGEAYIKANEFVNAKEAALKALEMAEANDAIKEQMASTNILYKIYKKDRLDGEALFYHEQHLRLKDSLFNIEKTRSMKRVQAEYDIQFKKEQEKFKDEREREAAEKLRLDSINQKEKDSIRSTGFIIGAILLIMLAGALWWRFKTEKESKVELEEKNEELQKTLLSKEEKEVLLKEIHHRVKNNMQIIMSLLRLQSQNIDNEYILGLYRESQNRIKSMALVHEELYQTNDFRAVSVQNYLEKLIDNLIITYSLKTNVDTDISIEVEHTGIDTLVPLGLLINEIISNSLEHGFKRRTYGNIYVKMKRTETNHIDLAIGDDGVGFPDDFKLENMTSLGLELIHSLVDQLDGDMTISAQNGINYHIVFKEQKESLDR